MRGLERRRGRDSLRVPTQGGARRTGRGLQGRPFQPRGVPRAQGGDPRAIVGPLVPTTSVAGFARRLLVKPLCQGCGPWARATGSGNSNSLGYERVIGTEGLVINSFVLIITQAPHVVGLALFQGTPLWEARLWAKAFRRQVAERARLPQGTAMQVEGLGHERSPCGACVIIRSFVSLDSCGARPCNLASTGIELAASRAASSSMVFPSPLIILQYLPILTLGSTSVRESRP